MGSRLNLIPVVKKLGRPSLPTLCIRCNVCRAPANYVKHAQDAAQLAEQGYEAASSVKQSYEAAASSVGAPMMLRNLISSRDSSRETCIWLIPSSWAMSDCER